MYFLINAEATGANPGMHRAQRGKIWMPQAGEWVSCSVHPSLNANSAQKEAHIADIYAHEKFTCGFYCVILFVILDVLDETFQLVYDWTDFKTLA